jgi:Raf kinase inhibitor-like YbhB/YbcL family protein
MALPVGFNRIVMIAVLVLVTGAGFFVMQSKNRPLEQDAQPLGYYAARGAGEIPFGRDMLGYDGTPMVAAEAPSTATANFINDNGLMIGPIAGTMTLSIDGMGTNRRIPAMSTCHRSNLSPGLSWSGAPARTKSFVVMFEKVEPDGKNPLYWSVYNIDAKITAIPGAVAQGPDIAGIGNQGKNHSENISYVGPCIPRGEHAFLFRVFALDTRLNLSGGATRDELVKQMNGHIIDIARVDAVHLYKM